VPNCDGVEHVAPGGAVVATARSVAATVSLAAVPRVVEDDEHAAPTKQTMTTLVRRELIRTNS